MDIRTGEIIAPEQIEEEKKKRKDNLITMLVDPTPKQLLRNPPRVGRNEPCPCGSGKRFKKCCLKT